MRRLSKGASRSTMSTFECELSATTSRSWPSGFGLAIEPGGYYLRHGPGLRSAEPSLPPS